jgi:amino acid permease
MSEQRSGWAVGWTYFAGFMMIMLGFWHTIAGLSAVIKDNVYALGQVGDGYFLKFNVTTWGWIHLVLGIVIILAGFGLFAGAVWARIIGVILAILSGLAAFAWLPYEPFWGVLLIAVAVSVIWALTVHGRDVTMNAPM